MVPPSTYLEFLLVFLGPVLFMLTVLVGLGGSSRRHDVYPLAVGVVVLLALAYTIPWDNYLIARGVWWYGDGTVAYLVWNAPIEEYLFIVLQPLVTALWIRVLSATAVSDDPDHETLGFDWRTRALGALGGLAVGGIGVAFILGTSTLYLGAILAWAAPVLAIQWAFGWPQLWRRRRTVLLAVLGPTAYFCIADWVAIQLGIWQLSPAYTTGYTVAGLPIEEALFFLVTNVFIVQGLVLYAWLVQRYQTLARDETATPGSPSTTWSQTVGQLMKRL